MTSRSVPFYYAPRQYQRAAWERRYSGQYDIYLKLWHRQAGKDTDDIQFALNNAWLNPGTQSAYVGLDNKWIRRNIWDKYVDGRKHWANYPSDKLITKDTQQIVKLLNNPADKAEALIQFIGFKESETLIGSSYDNFYVSELSLYRRNAFTYMQPIWDNKIAQGQKLLINMNFTPRGLNNVAADFLRTYTGEDDPAFWPGAHGRVFVDVLPANKSTLDDGSRLFTDEHLEKIRDRYIREMGNDNLFRQEYMCEFLAVNAGLVYPAIEVIRKENRYTPYNLMPDRPLFMAWDISSKDKETDWTSCIVFQFIDGRMIVYDWYEDNRKSVVECVQDLAKRPYFHLIRAAALPWDSDRSGSRNSPFEECCKAFPNIKWHKLDRAYVNDGINRVRKLMPNMIINSNNCDWVMECLENYEYREMTSLEDWSAKPKHNRYSHIADALRYCAELVSQVDYVRTNSGEPVPMPLKYEAWDLDDEDDWDSLPPAMRPSKFSKMRKKGPESVYGKRFLTERPWL